MVGLIFAVVGPHFLGNMKISGLTQAFLLLPIIAAFSCNEAAAQSAAPVANMKVQGPDELSSIARYLGNGDVDKLSAWFSASIEIVVLGESNICSRSQAKQILKAFYESYTPNSFEVTHKAAHGNVKYAVGSLKAGGTLFTVTLFLCLKETCYDIHQLKIEKL